MVNDVVQRLMAKLDFSIPPFVPRRHLRISYTRKGRNAWTLDLEGLSSHGKRFSYLSSTSVRPRRRHFTTPPSTRKKSPEPFSFTGTLSDNAVEGPMEFDVSLTFQGHYGEPPLVLNFVVPDAGVQRYEEVVQMDYDPARGEWAVEKQAQVASAGRAGMRVGD